MLTGIAATRRAIVFARRSGFLIAAALMLTQCIPSRRVNVAYQAPLRAAKDVDPKLPPVNINVLDKRPTPVVGHPIGAFGEKEGVIISESRAPAALKTAFEIELRSEGFRIGPGGNNLLVALSFFQSQYLHPLFWTRAVASIGIEVTVRRPDQSIAYNEFIVGQSEQDAETHFESGEEWASDVLNAAMNDAVDKTMADPAFLESLKTR